jgi:DNA-binding NtrC family response regulator
MVVDAEGISLRRARISSNVRTRWEAIRRGIAAACAAAPEDDLAEIVRTLQLVSADLDAFSTLHPLGADEQRALLALRAQALCWEREQARARFETVRGQKREPGALRDGKATCDLDSQAWDVESDPTPGLALIYSRLHAHLPSAVPLAIPIVTLGRECDNTLSIPESSVSRRHLRLERRDDGLVWIVDNDSLNGTFVNGRRVHEQALVAHDLVRVGDSMFRFVDKGIHGYGAYRIDGSVVRKTRPFAHGIERPALIGGYQIDALLDRVAQVAHSAVAVLMHGEVGTGKHLLARELHRASARTGPLVGLNCAALPEAQIDSELFGRTADAPGESDKPGLIRAAHGGTLFLDEVGDLPLAVQDKLLQVLEDQALAPLHPGDDPRALEHVDLRLVSATHSDLSEQVAEGRFRGRLWARIRELQLELPPLRERREDLYPLLSHFLAQNGHPPGAVSFAFVFALVHYPWPYNVGELESAIRVAVRLAGGAMLDLQHLPECVRRAIEQSGAAPADPSGTSSDLANQMCETAPAATINATEMAGGLGALRIRPSREVEPSAELEVPSEPTLRALLGDHGGDTEAVAAALARKHSQVLEWLRHYQLDAGDFRP